MQSDYNASAVFFCFAFPVGVHAHPLETQQQTEKNEEHEVGRNISSPEVSLLCCVILLVEEILWSR